MQLKGTSGIYSELQCICMHSKGERNKTEIMFGPGLCKKKIITNDLFRFEFLTEPVFN